MHNQLTATQRYEFYKNSGVDWLGDVPEHWDIIRLKNLAFVNPVSNFRQEELTDPACFLPMEYVDVSGKVNYEIIKEVKELTQGFTNFKKNDVIVAKITPCFENGKGAYLNLMPTKFGFGSTEFHVLRNKRGVDTKYLYYLTKSHFFMSLGEMMMTGSAGQKRVPSSFVAEFPVARPSYPEQTAIATFLDRKTTQIDDAISIKQKQIDLLKERKQILIQNAVTRGLNPNAPMRDSGVEWIGEIPAHWEVRRSKYLFTQRKERAWKTDIQLSATQAYGVIPQEEYEEKTGKRVVKIQFHLDKRRHVEKNDFVISMRSFQGGLERAWARGCIRSSYVVLRPLQHIEPSFYGYLLKLPLYIRALQRTASFIRDGQDLNFDNFSQVDLYIPPIVEQRKISSYVGSLLKSSNEGVALLEAQIDKLKEYKATLINSAVTGKIKVPLVKSLGATN